MTDPITGPTGYSLLHDPRLNRGTAFAAADRSRLGIEGLLPPGVDTLDLHVARVHTQMEALDSDLQKYLFLSNL